MSIQSQIIRIKSNVSDAYAAIEEKGGTFPQEQTSGYLADAIRSIPEAYDVEPPDKVYSETRPADWLPMPVPADNEMYLLVHMQNGASSLVAFTVTCTGGFYRDMHG